MDFTAGISGFCQYRNAWCRLSWSDSLPIAYNFMIPISQRNLEERIETRFLSSKTASPEPNQPFKGPKTRFLSSLTKKLVSKSNINSTDSLIKRVSKENVEVFQDFVES